MKRSLGSQFGLKVSAIQLGHLPHGSQALLVHHVPSRHLDGQRHSFTVSNTRLCLLLEDVAACILGLVWPDQPRGNDSCR